MISTISPRTALRPLALKAVAKPILTTMIVAQMPRSAGRYIADTQIGLGWNDAKAMLWTGEYVWPFKVMDIDIDAKPPTIADQTEPMARHLAQQTHAEECTPAHLLPLFRTYCLEWFEPDDSHGHPNDEHRISGRQMGVA